MTNQKSLNKKYSWLLLSIVALAIALRLPSLFFRGSFSFDEMVTVMIADKPLEEMVDYLVWENNPPLHYLFMHAWQSIFGKAEVMVRLSSVLIGGLSVLLIYWLTVIISANRRMALISPFLLAISVFHIYYSGEARMYPLVLFFSILSYIFFWLSWRERKKIYFLGYLLLLFLSLATHLTALVIPVVTTLTAWWFSRHERDFSFLKQIIFCHLLSGILFLPWLAAFLATKMTVQLTQGWYFTTRADSLFLFSLPRDLMLFDGRPFLSFLLFLMVLVIFAASLIKIKRSPDRKYWIGLRNSRAVIFSWFAFLTPALGGFILNVGVLKYYTVSLAGLVLVLALGMDNIAWFRRHLSYVLIVLFFLMLPSFVERNFQSFENWDLIAAEIESQEKRNDKIITANYVHELMLDYYYQGNLPYQGFFPFKEKDDLLKRIIKYNWLGLISEEQASALQAEARGFSRIWFITSPRPFASTRVENLLHQWFWANGFKEEKRLKFPGRLDPEVVLYSRND